MIVFKKVSYRNFFATGNAGIEIDLSTHPTTLITGTNGAGKSTMLSAICFALYGKPYRNINKNQIINSVNGKNCLTEIEFSVGGKEYKVRRGLKPNIFEIFVDGELVGQEASVRDYQTILEANILKMNYQVFCQVVIIGKGYTPFMALTASARREVIEDLLDIKVFSSMFTLAKARVNDVKEEIREIKQSVSLIKNKIDIKQDHATSLKQASLARVDSLEKSKQEKADELATLQSELERVRLEEATLDDVIVKKRAYQSKKNQVEGLTQRLSSSAGKIEKQLEFFSEHTECPTCSQTITHDYKDMVLSSKKKRLSEIIEALSQLADKSAEVDANIKEFEGKHKHLQNIIIEKTRLSTRISEIQEGVLALDRMILENTSSDDTQLEAVTDEIRQLTEDGKSLVSALTDVKDKLNYLEIAVACLKDSGIRADVIKKYVPLINQKVNHYLSLFEFWVLFELDENFNESIKSRHRDEFTYFSFSEGEKQRIDLALLFAWRDVAKAKNAARSNLLIFDEVLDGSLEQTAVDNLLGIIRSMGEEHNVFVISHRPGHYDVFSNHIIFEKVGNFSEIIE
jgi:DNA repair exonuclease SbcCD ATPase subunit